MKHQIKNITMLCILVILLKLIFCFVSSRASLGMLDYVILGGSYGFVLKFTKHILTLKALFILIILYSILELALGLVVIKVDEKNLFLIAVSLKTASYLLMYVIVNKIFSYKNE